MSCEDVFMVQREQLRDGIPKWYGIPKTNATQIKPGKRLYKIADNEDLSNITDYQSATEYLMYASVATRPDLLTAMGVLAHDKVKSVKEH